MEFFIVSGGRFKLDGGSMFGIVPKPLWEKICPPDEHNRIDNGTNCLLVRTGSSHILIDTGYGDKMTEKERGIYGMSGTTIVDSLAAMGVKASDIDLVILSHLHFDHAGGATVSDLEGHVYPTFPKAKYVVQKGEWEDAMNGYATMTTTYREENYVPLMDQELLTLLDGDVEVWDRIRVQVSGGHTRYHQMVLIESDEATVVFPGDILPMTTHLRAPYNMGYDLFPYDSMVQKMQVLEQAASEGWILIWDHDPNVPAGRVYKEGEGRFRFEAVSFKA
jgi:glyoxylase-like metal-dependent hydrolase (beta-lactamase superfamily II)